jgi:hypothetical protein
MTDHQDHDTEAAPTAAAELAEPAAASGEDNTAAAPTDHATELIETGAAPTPELAWSEANEEQQTEAVSEKPSRVLWLGPVMALLAAVIAVASVLVFYTHRAPATNAPVTTPPVMAVAPEKASQPKTLEAATAAAQEDANRYSSGDIAGDWEMGSKQVHDGISKTDYVTLEKTCKDTGIPITVTGVRMEGTDTAIVRQEIKLLGGFTQSLTMVYEEGQWVWTPSDKLIKELGKPIDQIIADEKADGNCLKAN